MSENKLDLGDVVSLKTDLNREKEGTLAYVYSTSTLGHSREISCVSINGIDLGSFNMADQRTYLHYVGKTYKVYNYKNLEQMGLDFADVIRPLFDDISMPDPDLITDKKQQSWRT